MLLVDGSVPPALPAPSKRRGEILEKIFLKYNVKFQALKSTKTDNAIFNFEYVIKVCTQILKKI